MKTTIFPLVCNVEMHSMHRAKHIELEPLLKQYMHAKAFQWTNICNGRTIYSRLPKVNAEQEKDGEEEEEEEDVDKEQE